MELIPRTLQLTVLMEEDDIIKKIEYLQEWLAYLINVKNQRATRKELSLQIISLDGVKSQDTILSSGPFIN